MGQKVKRKNADRHQHTEEIREDFPLGPPEGVQHADTWNLATGLQTERIKVCCFKLTVCGNFVKPYKCYSNY